MEIELPQVLADMTKKYDARYVKPHPTDVMAYFVEVPTKLGNISSEIRDTVLELCEVAMGTGETTRVVGNFEIKSAGVVVGETAINVFMEHSRKHGYEGTLVLSLLERVAESPNLSRFTAIKEKLRKNRHVDPMSWELVRHLGRPSIPKEILPVFAVYEAEKRLGRPIKRLSEAQMRIVGL